MTICVGQQDMMLASTEVDVTKPLIILKIKT